MGVAEDYQQSLVPLIIQHLGYKIVWSSISDSDLIIFGPFFKKPRDDKWIPKPLRSVVKISNFIERNVKGKISIFQTGENIRHNHLEAHFSLSFDLGVDSDKHLRLPYWMELVDWSHEGIYGNKNPRFGRLLDLTRLGAPLGEEFLKKPLRTVLFASHLGEPRSTLFKAVSKYMPITGMGPIFDKSIKDHNNSPFTKFDIMKEFSFNLCPENSMYPGYYTEKIPESFMGNCLPLSWVDESVSVDFNPRAFINLAPMMKNGFEYLEEILTSKNILGSYAEQALLLQTPTLQYHIEFINSILKLAKS